MIKPLFLQLLELLKILYFLKSPEQFYQKSHLGINGNMQEIQRWGMDSLMQDTALAVNFVLKIWSALGVGCI